MMVSGERTVIVRDRPHVVTIYKKSTTVWMAVGDYRGMRISVQDVTEGAVLERWRQSAERRKH